MKKLIALIIIMAALSCFTSCDTVGSGPCIDDNRGVSDFG